MELNQSFWKNKKVFITGHTGFKGSWLSIWLQEMGALVTGLSLPPTTTPNLYNEADVGKTMNSIKGDIRDLGLVKNVMQEAQPEIIFHMAAQALVKYSYINPIETYETNVMGSLNILEAVKTSNSVRAVVMITTDKCYENKEWELSYRENDPMGGFDPYSSSKACAEILISSYRRSYFQDSTNGKRQVPIASARAGNVIGGGDWTERLIPDIVNSIKNNQQIVIRNPKSVRPWQHVLEPLKGYLMLAEKLYESGQEYAQAWNFGPNASDAQPVDEVVRQLVDMWGLKNDWQLQPQTQTHEAKTLRLDCTKAASQLNWKPTWNLSTALKTIVEWYSQHSRGESARMLCTKQIQTYINQ